MRTIALVLATIVVVASLLATIPTSQRVGHTDAVRYERQMCERDNAGLAPFLRDDCSRIR